MGVCRVPQRAPQLNLSLVVSHCISVHLHYSLCAVCGINNNESEFRGYLVQRELGCSDTVTMVNKGIDCRLGSQMRLDQILDNLTV